VIRHRLADGRPLSVINIASVLGIRPLGHIAPYAAAKAGLINLGRELCVDLAAKGIRVNALAPGYFETEMNREWLKSPAGQRLLKGIPAGRFGQPDDLDGAILFLASDASVFMNGSLMVVDGGHTAGL
ncbi:MAG: SDR family oxidoreductase, partial [Gammaproteobacteria bacterium]